MYIEQPFLEPVTNHRILIVDDNPQNVQILGRLLQDKKYEIEFSTNGKAALEWLEFQSFDLVLLDINMPEMDGFEVCRKIRSNTALKNLPVLFLSADSDRESLLKGFGLGAQDYITKPFDSRELIERVKMHLALKDSLEKLEKVNKYLEDTVMERTAHLQIANEELRKLNSDLIVAKDRAEASDRLKTAFLNNISHEIRTPLNSILGFAPIVIQPNLLQEEKEAYLTIMEESCERLVTTLTDYIDMSLIVSDNIDINPNTFDCFSFTKNLHKSAFKRCNEKQLKLILQKFSDKENVLLFTDEDLFFKSFMHIIDNAIKFTPSGSISIGFELKNENLVFYIKDTGIGISQEAQKQIFDAFMQENISNTRIYQGSGLGLNIAMGLIKILGGKLWLESEKGHGTTVFISMPI